MTTVLVDWIECNSTELVGGNLQCTIGSSLGYLVAHLELLSVLDFKLL